MTLCIYDGENFLVDKIVQMDVNTSKRHNDETIDCYFQTKSKLVLPKNGFFKNTLNGRKIKLYTVIGNARTERNMCHALEQVSMDINNIISVSKSFPNSDILDTESRHLFIDEDGTLTQLKRRYDTETGDPDITEHFWSSERFPDIGCITFGYCEDFLYDFEKNLLKRNMTALEMMVLGQAKYPVLGRKFDCWNFKSGKVQENIDLSDRVRMKILDKLKADINFDMVDPVQLINTNIDN